MYPTTVALATNNGLPKGFPRVPLENPKFVSIPTTQDVAALFLMSWPLILIWLVYHYVLVAPCRGTLVVATF